MEKGQLHTEHATPFNYGGSTMTFEVQDQALPPPPSYLEVTTQPNNPISDSQGSCPSKCCYRKYCPNTGAWHAVVLLCLGIPLLIYFAVDHVTPYDRVQQDFTFGECMTVKAFWVDNKTSCNCGKRCR